MAAAAEATAQRGHLGAAKYRSSPGEAMQSFQRDAIAVAARPAGADPSCTPRSVAPLEQILSQRGDDTERISGRRGRCASERTRRRHREPGMPFCEEERRPITLGTREGPAVRRGIGYLLAYFFSIAAMKPSARNPSIRLISM
jgi:hypothetical protein